MFYCQNTALNEQRFLEITFPSPINLLSVRGISNEALWNLDEWRRQSRSHCRPQKILRLLMMSKIKLDFTENISLIIVMRTVFSRTVFFFFCYFCARFYLIFVIVASSCFKLHFIKRNQMWLLKFFGFFLQRKY